MADEKAFGPAAGADPPPVSANETPRRHRLRDKFEDQLALRSVIHEYMIPEDTNTVWYTLGGVLGIALVLEILTGFLLATRYVPDAGRAYGITKSLLKEPGWSVALNFHYWNSYLIFALVMVHMMRVFISAAYRTAKKGLWLVGVGLAGLVFLLSLTGETLHWDERGFAVPWHVAEFFEAIGLAGVLHYGRPDLLTVPSATGRLAPFYALHIAILPILLLGFIAMHYYLVKVKGISLPFWHKPTGRRGPFAEHIKAWLMYGGAVMGVILLVAIFVNRGPGPAPQLLPSSPFYGSEHGPGGLGIVPTFPISWTHGMNRFVALAFHLEPDIWGTVLGMVLLTGALVVVPFVDRGTREPLTWSEAFNMRERKWAFVAIGLFWLVMIVGVATNIITPTG